MILCLHPEYKVINKFHSSNFACNCKIFSKDANLDMWVKINYVKGFDRIIMVSEI